MFLLLSEVNSAPILRQVKELGTKAEIQEKMVPDLDAHGGACLELQAWW